MIQLGSETPRRRRRVPSLFTGLTALRRSVQVPGSSTVGQSAPHTSGIGLLTCLETDDSSTVEPGAVPTPRVGFSH
jgi:hypothetical protein